MATLSGARWRNFEESDVISSDDESDIDDGEESDEDLPAAGEEMDLSFTNEDVSEFNVVQPEQDLRPPLPEILGVPGLNPDFIPKTILSDEELARHLLGVFLSR